MVKPIRVLVVDDSAMVRDILTRGLSKDHSIEVVGAAPDPYAARDMIIKHRPDVITLDVEMPRMDGVEFLKKLMPQFPLPVVMVSSLTPKGGQLTMDSLAAGAVDFVTKPTTNVSRGLTGMIEELTAKVKVASRANVSHWKNRKAPPESGRVIQSRILAGSTDKVIAIGASTGGTEAIRAIITRFPSVMPGVVIVQHMPAGFTRMFAERMDSLCAMQVKEAEPDDRLYAGRILIAPGGDAHIEVVRSGGEYRVRFDDREKVCGHRPSVEVLMQSMARNVGQNAVGVILTGMGHDGADGLAALRRSGGRTLAQDEATSVVFGMPKTAFERGGAEKLVPLPEMADEIAKLMALTPVDARSC